MNQTKRSGQYILNDENRRKVDRLKSEMSYNYQNLTYSEKVAYINGIIKGIGKLEEHFAQYDEVYMETAEAHPDYNAFLKPWLDMIDESREKAFNTSFMP